MQAVLTNFIRALRSAEVPVSVTEAIDAAGTLALIGYNDKTALRDAFSVVLAKSEDEKEIVQRVFDLYFARVLPAAASGAGQQASDTANLAANPGNTQNGAEPGESQASWQSFMSLAQGADPAQLAMAIESAAEAAGVPNIQFATQAAYFGRRMMQALGVEALERELIERLQEPSEQAQARAQALMDARNELGQQVRRYIDHQFEVFGRPATNTYMNRIVQKRPLSGLDRREMERLKVLVSKMAKRLAEKHSKRRRHHNRGQIDIRRTMRANAGHDFIPFEVAFKRKRRDKPKIVAVCDVSASVSDTVRFLLMFLYSLNESLADISTFAFSNQLYDVAGYLDELDFDTAFNEILRDAGGGSTDYGQAFTDLRNKHWPVIDRRTTLLILGDGRSNYGDSGIDILKQAAARARRVVWLCPESHYMWGTGDSYLLRYRAHCNQLTHCASVVDLERAIDQILATYN